jgi:hypothetical protein
MNPSGITTGERDFEFSWLLTGVSKGIDLNRMSTASRRDFPLGVSGSHMALSPETPFREIQFADDKTPPNSFLLTMTGRLLYGDYTTIPDPVFSGKYYDADHGYSQEVFIENSGEYEALGLDTLLRLSFPAHQLGLREIVGAMLPSARAKLRIAHIKPLETGSPPVPVYLFGESEPVSSEVFYK